MGMDPSTPQHQVMQVTNSSSLEDVLINCSKPLQQQQQQQLEMKSNKRPNTQPEQALKCPRCDSSNTKFCYYNNYSLSQPRYFCKGCRRYWTQGGSLRNVPVGGGCRKTNKRPSPSSSSCSSKKTPQDHQIFTINSNPSQLVPGSTTSLLPHLTYDSNDLTLAFSRLHKQQQPTSTTMQLGFDQILLGNPTTTTTKTTHNLDMNSSTLGSPNTSTENNNNNSGSGFLDALRSGLFLEPQSGFHNFQYGFGNCNVEGDQLDNQNGGGGGIDNLPYQEITSSTTTTTTRTEDYFCNKGGGREGASHESKVFVNFPWHQFSTTTGDGGNFNVDSSSAAAAAAASGRDQYWNNGFGSSWHGLVNSL